MRLFLALVIAYLLFLGCNVRQHQINKMHQYAHFYPDSLAKDCAQLFPIKDSVGKPIIPVNIDRTNEINALKKTADSLRSIPPLTVKSTPLDSSRYLNAIMGLQSKINALQAAYKPCLPEIVPHYIVDSALVVALRNQLKLVSVKLHDTTIKLTDKTADATKWFWVAMGALAAILLYIGISIYKFFSGGAIVGEAKTIISKL